MSLPLPVCNKEGGWVKSYFHYSFILWLAGEFVLNHNSQ